MDPVAALIIGIAAVTGIVLLAAMFKGELKGEAGVPLESEAERAARITEAGLNQRVSATESEVARIGHETRDALLTEALRRMRQWKQDGK